MPIADTTLLGAIITLLIIIFIILIVWSRFQHQTMKNTLLEIRDIVKEWKQ